MASPVTRSPLSGQTAVAVTAAAGEGGILLGAGHWLWGNQSILRAASPEVHGS